MVIKEKIFNHIILYFCVEAFSLSTFLTIVKYLYIYQEYAKNKLKLCIIT